MIGDQIIFLAPFLRILRIQFVCFDLCNSIRFSSQSPTLQVAIFNSVNSSLPVQDVLGCSGMSQDLCIKLHACILETVVF